MGIKGLSSNVIKQVWRDGSLKDLPRGTRIGVDGAGWLHNDIWLQHRPQRTTRRTADGSRTAQIASHGRLTACRSRLVRYPDRADDRRT
ncbi:hypothetical protein Ctob_016525 [Chrysochromulina tobinii]|uniref:Uncharacterized protein n=1 Tax=Chrysochromulina tobinii TaxID=1460289 RepID=A0A0M0K426_9EUKA|nr:hypothetical protein Ctob_016525 [Chrysochromulina tobinii]|eukprot:KOO33362.1 hypothetical protein Ctob_016525 [Chrysochromulina sp. CCMP291]